MEGPAEAVAGSARLIQHDGSKDWGSFYCNSHPNQGDLPARSSHPQRTGYIAVIPNPPHPPQTLPSAFRAISRLNLREPLSLHSYTRSAPYT